MSILTVIPLGVLKNYSMLKSLSSFDSRQRIFNSIIVFVFILAFANLAFARQYAIVAINKDQKLKVYTIDEEGGGGSLKLLQSVNCAGRPGAMCVDSTAGFLFVAKKASGSIATYQIYDSGKLSFVREVEVGADASFLKVHPDGKFLISSYYKAGQVAVHRIDADGALSETGYRVYKTDKNAHSVAIDPTGKFIFISHTRPNAIFQFHFDIKTGQLTKNKVSKLQREENSGPRHLWFHSQNGSAYGSDEQGSRLTAYRLNPSGGSLEVVQSVSSLPSEYDGRNSTSDIEVHPSGRFVYIANRGHNTIAGFTIEKRSGNLKLIEHIATETTTRSFNISPDGKFLIAAGQKSGKLALFKIDQDGKLKRLSTTVAGASPWWVEIIKK